MRLEPLIDREKHLESRLYCVCSPLDALLLLSSTPSAEVCTLLKSKLSFDLFLSSW